MKNKRVIAVEFPAPCGQECKFCRSPDNAEGKPDDVISLFWDTLRKFPAGEVFVVSSGETGAARDFESTVGQLLAQGIKVSVACAAPISVVPGLCRVDVSATSQTHAASMLAIEKALNLGIHTTISLVDDGTEDIAERMGFFTGEFPEIRGCLVRKLQRAGRAKEAKEAGGETRFEVFPPNMPMGYWPPPAYVELAGLIDKRVALTCIDRWGRIVPFVGNYVPAPKEAAAK